MNYFNFTDNELKFGNDLFERVIFFDKSRPAKSVLSGCGFSSVAEGNIIDLPNFDWASCSVKASDNCLYFTGNINIKWVFRIYDNLPAFTSQLFVMGNPVKQNAECESNVSSGVETGEKKADEHEVIESIGSSCRHLKMDIVTFFDNTDKNNNLIKNETQMVYSIFSNSADGHIFSLNDYINSNEILIAKNAPSLITQLNRKDSDLLIESPMFSVCGSGIDYACISPDYYTPSYSVTIGMCKSGEWRSLFKEIYRQDISCNRYIMSNTWGDRNQDKCICEEFVFSEITKAAQIGIDVVQIDDGWQKGTTANSAVKKSNLWCGGYRNSDPDFWEVNKEKFPDGLQRIVNFAAERGVRIGLWFSPDGFNEYESWQMDVDTLFGFYKSFGIRYFKLDGIDIVSKRAETNLLRMLQQLDEKSHGEITFNMDITAGRRLGYLYGREYGTLFVENRYTDWGNYYPHNTLRNLWQLSSVLPTEKLLFEFLNNRRNIDKYNDILAPSQYDITYLFATVMVAEPLAWMELSGLNEDDAEKLSEFIGVYKQYRDDFLNVRPIGDCPDGLSLTGFEIDGSERKYVLLFREMSQKDSFDYDLKKILFSNTNASQGRAVLDKMRTFVLAEI